MNDETHEDIELEMEDQERIWRDTEMRANEMEQIIRVMMDENSIIVKKTESFSLFFMSRSFNCVKSCLMSMTMVLMLMMMILMIWLRTLPHLWMLVKSRT